MSEGLQVSGLSVVLSGVRILQGVDFTVSSGSVTGLVGPNGAGKSTLLRSVLGLTPIAEGAVRFDGEDFPALPRRRRAQLAALVEQSESTDTRLTVRDVVNLGRIPFQTVWQTGPSSKDILEVEAGLAALDMTAFVDRQYDTLSGGEQQRVQIARALAQEPRLLLLDEPTSHLDPKAQLQVLKVLQRRARAGATVVLTMHDLNLAAAFCDTIIVLHEGTIAAAGRPGDVLTAATLRKVYGVDASILSHPNSGRPVIAYDLPADLAPRTD